MTSSSTPAERDGERATRQKITPHLWFDDQADEAAAFYASLFDGSSIGRTTRYGKEGYEIHGQPEGKVMTVNFTVAGYEMTALNGGPGFEFTPAISFFVTCESETEVDELWRRLSEDGSTLMALQSYDWSEKYGWVQDRFGVTWQLSLGILDDGGQKIMPCLTFVSPHGQAEDAVGQYTSLFDDSSIANILRYCENEAQPQGAVQFAQVQLNGEPFTAMDSSPEFADFSFNEAISLLVACDSKQEIDHFWDGLARDGDPAAHQCGWLKDRFGVSWQVWPTLLGRMLQDPDQDKVDRVTKAFLRMKKLDIRALQRAYEG